MTTVRRAHAGKLVDPGDVVSQLRAAGHSVGRTRQAVVDAVRRQPPSFTAEELAAALPDVHVATVYRTLGLLEEIGALRHVHLSHGPAIYEQADAEETRHLVCEVCNRHYAVPSDIFETARQRLAEEFGFLLDGSHFAIVGRCAACV